MSRHAPSTISNLARTYAIAQLNRNDTVVRCRLTKHYGYIFFNKDGYYDGLFLAVPKRIQA